MEKGKLSDASILRQPYGYDYLQRYTTFACGGEKERIALEDRLEWLSSDPLKAEMILWEMEKCRKYEDYIKLLDIYGNYLTTVNHQQRLDAVSAKLYKGAAGKLASMHQKRSEGEPNKGRYMTIREAAAIQGMQDLNFSSLSSTRTLEALGNAINVTLVRRIAKLLLNDEQQ